MHRLAAITLSISSNDCLIHAYTYAHIHIASQQLQ